VQLSGLAAADPRDPQLMTTAFVVLGSCSIGLGAALGRVAAPRSAGPWLVMAAGAATAAVGVFRRFRADPDWAVLARPVQVLALASAVAVAVFASGAVEPWNGVVQRVAVTLASLPRSSGYDGDEGHAGDGGRGDRPGLVAGWHQAVEEVQHDQNP